jgi:Tfp pilus assembly protein PilE
MAVVVAMAGVLAAIAVPAFMNSMNSYRLSSAVAASAGAIQSSRFQAIMHGYQDRRTSTRLILMYQICSMVPPATVFSAENSLIAIARWGDAAIGPANTNAQINTGTSFHPMLVSGRGNVSVTHP